MNDTQKLIERVERLAGRTGASTSTLSRKLFGNGKRFDEIKAGGTITMAKFANANRELAKMESQASNAATGQAA